MTLAGLARDTTTIRLGTLVTSATFRLPGPLAIAVAGVDQMSGGRVELGLGAGWYEREHDGLRHPVPPARRALRPPRGAARRDHRPVATPAASLHVRRSALPVADSPALPKPVQDGGMPIIVGGGGPTRTPALAARFAAEFNHRSCRSSASSSSASGCVAACEAIGRDPATMTWSAAAGRLRRRRRRRVRPPGRGDRPEPDELRENGVAGTPGRVHGHDASAGTTPGVAALPPSARPRRSRSSRRHRRARA